MRGVVGLNGDIETLRSFLSRVVGESFRNDDGKNRQTILSVVEPGMPVDLVREPANRFDPAAVAVHVRGLGQIGYLPRGHRLEADIEAGAIRARVNDVHGGTPGKPARGASLKIEILARASASDAGDAVSTRSVADRVRERSFRCRLVDTEAVNADGTERQALLSKVTPGMPVELEWERKHVSDTEAVAVRVPGLGQIGYLREGHGIALDVSLGFVRATVARVEGGTKRKPLRGAMLAVDVLEPPPSTIFPARPRPPASAVSPEVAVSAAVPSRRSALRTGVVWTGIVAVGIGTLQALFGGSKRAER